MPIRISYEEQSQSCSVTLQGGEKISNSDKSYSFSIGMCGYYNGQRAIVTCGHGNENIGSRGAYITYNDTRIGQVTYQRCNTELNVLGCPSGGDLCEEDVCRSNECTDCKCRVQYLGDFAIVGLNDGATTTSNVLYWNDELAMVQSLNITGYETGVPEGTLIYKYGFTTGFSYGLVTEAPTTGWTTYSHLDENGFIKESYYVYGLYRAEMMNKYGTAAVDGGDSGGSVYRKDGTNVNIIGIVTSKKAVADSDILTDMSFTPFEYIIDQGFSLQ